MNIQKPKTKNYIKSDETLIYSHCGSYYIRKTINKKTVHIGRAETIEEAIKIRDQYLKEHNYGERKNNNNK